MSTTEFKPIETIDQLTIPRLKETILFVYGSTIAKGFTDRFYKVIYEDLKEKHRNLRWLLGDNLRIACKLQASTVLNGIKDTNTFSKFDTFCTSNGVTYTPESLIEDVQVVYKKQKVNLKNLLTTVKPDDETWENYTLSTHTFHAELDGRNQQVINAHYILPNGLIARVKDTFMYIPKEEITVKMSSTFSSDDLNRLISSISSPVIYLSMEPADILLAGDRGEGTSSCHRIEGDYHLGNIVNLRSDFGLIAYTHSSSDRYKKTGRQWVWLRASEKGIPLALPHYKIHRQYGNLTVATTSAIVKTINEHMQTNLGISSSDMVVTPNYPIKEHCGFSYAGGIGYLDGYGDRDKTPWVTHKNFRGNYGVLAFPHKDAIWFAGKPTQSSNIKQTNTRNVPITPIKFVKDIHGVEQYIEACLELPNGQYVLKDELIAFYGRTPSDLVLQPDTSIPVTNETKVEDIDVEDF